MTASINSGRKTPRTHQSSDNILSPIVTPASSISVVQQDAHSHRSSRLSPFMSASVRDGASSPKHTESKNATKEQTTSSPSGANYKGFVGGVFSGIAKLSVGYISLP